jgi:hypothetical protein
VLSTTSVARACSANGISIALAYEALPKRADIDGRRSGLLGSCVGGAFALMGAASPRIRDRVSFVSAYAPYRSMWTLTRDHRQRVTVSRRRFARAMYPLFELAAVYQSRRRHAREGTMRGTAGLSAMERLHMTAPTPQ